MTSRDHCLSHSHRLRSHFRLEQMVPRFFIPIIYFCRNCVLPIISSIYLNEQIFFKQTNYIPYKENKKPKESIAPHPISLQELPRCWPLGPAWCVRATLCMLQGTRWSPRQSVSPDKGRVPWIWWDWPQPCEGHWDCVCVTAAREMVDSGSRGDLNWSPQAFLE